MMASSISCRFLRSSSPSGCKWQKVTNFHRRHWLVLAGYSIHKTRLTSNARDLLAVSVSAIDDGKFHQLHFLQLILSLRLKGKHTNETQGSSESQEY